MRTDNIGLFWEDFPIKQKGTVQRIMPEIPETNWWPPKEYPDLRNAKVLAIDVETYDPDLEDKGPGWARGAGHIVGISIAPDLNHSWYFPIRHETQKEDNLCPEKTILWLRDTLATKRLKIGANITYDLGWLKQEGIEVCGPFMDIQFAEALLDETAKVALDVLGQKYLGQGKETNLLYQWLADWFGGEPTQKQRKWIYKAPPKLVGPYAEGDVNLPLRLAPVLYKKLEAENLLEVFDLENRLIPLMLEMRFAGVRVDTQKAEQVSSMLFERIKKTQNKLNQLVGSPVDINKKSDLEKAFKQLNIPFNHTAPTKSFPQGQPSFTRNFLEKLSHPIGELIREVRRCEKLKGTFVDSYVLENHVNGRIFGQFHQLRGDSGGTRSGRFSSSTPNLQNLPSRDDELAPLVRSLFVPDEGHFCWRKYDYNQIEYRCLIHDAVGIPGEEVRASFNREPFTDYHKFIQTLVKEQTGQWIERKAIKSINFGLIYGMGISTLATTLGLNKKEGKKLVDSYHKGVPFAKLTMDYYTNLAAETGEISTILGRKSRFTLWEPKNSIAEKPLPFEQALRTWSDIKRAYTHKALNRRLQGSAADIMKKTMLKCWEDGIFHETGVPRLTVHDELDFSDPGGKEEAFSAMHQVMETAVSLKIPIKADYESGPDWGHVK